MIASSVSIIVKIENYDAAFEYSGYIRPVGSTETINETSINYALNTNDIIKFYNLDAQVNYEVGVRKHCMDKFSPVVWQEVGSIECLKPTVTFNVATLTFALSFPPAATHYEWRINDGQWVKKAVSLTTVTIAEINAATGNYVTAHPNAIIDYQFRSICDNFNKSVVNHYLRVTTPVVDVKLDFVSNTCVLNQHDSQKLRITIGEGNKAGQQEVISIGTTQLIIFTRTANGFEDIKTLKEFFGGFNVLKALDSANPAIIKAASFDFLSKIPPYTVVDNEIIPCGNYVTAFTAANYSAP